MNGKPTGSVRVSFGYMSTKRDAESFLQFVKDSFVLKRTKMSDPVAGQTGEHFVTRFIWSTDLFPQPSLVKCCYNVVNLHLQG